MENAPAIKKEDSPTLLPTAKALFKSGLFPHTKNEFGAYAIVEYGFELGIPPMTALQTMAIISGKICMAGQMMLSIALRNGLEYKIIKDSTEECQVYLKFKNTEYTSSFTIAEAKQAGVYRDNSGWTKFPKDMLFWRAITRGLRRVCPDLILGLYAKEEIEGAPPLEAVIIDGEQAGEKETQEKSEEIPPSSPTMGFQDYYTRMSEIKNIHELKAYWTKHFGELKKNLTPAELEEITLFKDHLKQEFEEKK